MKKICILMAVVLLAAAPIMLWAQADGAALFSEKCSMCHGAKGEGNGGMPVLKGTSMTTEKLAELLLKGDSTKTVHANPGPTSPLNEEQAKAVAAFVKGLK